MRITGKEWANLSDQEKADALQAYLNIFSEDDSFLQFIIVGKRPIRQMLAVDGAKGLKMKPALLMNEDTGKLQLYPVYVAVDRHGNELPPPEGVEFDEEDDSEADRITIMGDTDPKPVKCPTVCS